jgi:hypothetical protein
MQIDETFASVPAVPAVPAVEPAMPDAPQTKVKPTKTAEDLELEKLMAETGMTPAQ